MPLEQRSSTQRQSDICLVAGLESRTELQLLSYCSLTADVRGISRHGGPARSPPPSHPPPSRGGRGRAERDTEPSRRAAPRSLRTWLGLGPGVRVRVKVRVRVGVRVSVACAPGGGSKLRGPLGVETGGDLVRVRARVRVRVTVRVRAVRVRVRVRAVTVAGSAAREPVLPPPARTCEACRRASQAVTTCTILLPTEQMVHECRMLPERIACLPA